jgi:hypothetical protein
MAILENQDEAPRVIDEYVASIEDWRGDRLAEVRAWIKEAVPDVVETWKWMGSPVWEKDGIMVVGNAHKDKVKLTFQFGALYEDEHGLFNFGAGSQRRGIDVFENTELNKEQFIDLVRAAAEYNTAKKAAKKK